MIPLERKGWRNSGWGKETYMVSMNCRYFDGGTVIKYSPLAGGGSEQTTPDSVLVQFVPPNSGRLKSVTFLSSATPGVTEVTLFDNNLGSVLGTKSINLNSIGDLFTLDFTKDLSSGTPYFNGTGTLAIGVNPTSGSSNMNVYAVFEVDK